MRYTVNIEDDIYEKAQQMAEPGLSPSDLFREAFLAYVRVKTAQRLHELTRINVKRTFDTISKDNSSKE